jgi:hypothetical protein
MHACGLSPRTFERANDGYTIKRTGTIFLERLRGVASLQGFKVEARPAAPELRAL